MELQETANPLLNALRIPGETFRIPSQGLFYEKGTLDQSVKDGELELYPMTAIDEIILSTPDKLLSGKAILEVFAHCIPQVKNPHALLAKDVDFLMVCLRLVSFGQFIDVLYTHNCENASEHTYSIDIQQIIRETRSLDPTTTHQEYQVVLKNGQIVKLRPMTYGDVVDLYQSTMSMKTDSDLEEKEAERMIVGTLGSMISSVNDISDRALISEWIRQIPLGYKKQIQTSLQSVGEWGIDMKASHICKDCGEVVELRVSTNPVNFFT